jgi:hypothetical protein
MYYHAAAADSRHKSRPNRQATATAALLPHEVRCRQPSPSNTLLKPLNPHPRGERCAEAKATAADGVNACWLPRRPRVLDPKRLLPLLLRLLRRRRQRGKRAGGCREAAVRSRTLLLLLLLLLLWLRGG